MSVQESRGVMQDAKHPKGEGAPLLGLWAHFPDKSRHPQISWQDPKRIATAVFQSELWIQRKVHQRHHLLMTARNSSEYTYTALWLIHSVFLSRNHLFKIFEVLNFKINFEHTRLNNLELIWKRLFQVFNIGLIFICQLLGLASVKYAKDIQWININVFFVPCYFYTSGMEMHGRMFKI